MEVVEFKSKFVENPKEPHEFERDNYIFAVNNSKLKIFKNENDK